MTSPVSKIHKLTAKKIKAGKRGYAQMKHKGQTISWHQGVFGGDTFTGTVPTSWKVAEARAAFIDAWAKGKAEVTPGTFTVDQILARAKQWDQGYGPLIKPSGSSDPELADQIRELID